jgi:hypothetical protein
MIRAPNLEDVSLEIQHTAAEVLIEGEVGEASRMKYVDSILVVNQFEEELRDKSSSKRTLRKHLSQFASTE